MRKLKVKMSLPVKTIFDDYYAVVAVVAVAVVAVGDVAARKELIIYPSCDSIIGKNVFSPTTFCLIQKRRLEINFV
jgi:hypothetical protein